MGSRRSTQGMGRGGEGGREEDDKVE